MEDNIILKRLRKNILNSIQNSDSGHLGPSFSCLEILYAIMKNNINFKKKLRSRIILSKGHAAPALYGLFDHFGLLKKNELSTLRKFKSRLQGHPDKKKLKILDFGTGALGQGLSVAIGYSLAFKLQKRKDKIYCILGDGELQEGQIWEAAMYIGSKKINNVLTFIDGNKFQNEKLISETLKETNLKKKWESFGFKFLKIDGHSINHLNAIIKNFNQKKHNKPMVVYCDTIKGKGVSFMEGENKYHSVKKLPSTEYDQAMRELDE